MTEAYLQGEVEQYIKIHKILKKDFAAKIGVTPVMLSHWLKGRTAFKRSVLERIIAVLDGN